ncbi:GNAT family N-acetyltransferase [Vibrio azureus]|uniref:N-acetyltransferase domain-containing protein n=1 Tax=Vibrio azureus NBRC 104587 TaxID=1219077 RepID=U3CF21_9VIBR|nr:GNAT family N-acetyltransferase [Vibrio azureus]AUI88032.1 GNAT family N-acetyltransferase [Vibrio azureus]GAD76893.1 hypothetical protein VAZ01S_055_00190 [Vibrio azureus NBRC 104587]
MEIKAYNRGMLAELSELYLTTRTTAFNWLDTSDYQLSDFEKDTDGECIWVAFSENKIVGFISIWEPDCFIHHLYVAKSYQGKNVGKKLLQKAKSLYPTLSLKCMTKNKQAIDFYQKNDFISVSKNSDSLGCYYLMKFTAPSNTMN